MERNKYEINVPQIVYGVQIEELILQLQRFAKVYPKHIVAIGLHTNELTICSEVLSRQHDTLPLLKEEAQILFD